MYEYFNAPIKNPFKGIAELRKELSETKEKIEAIDVEDGRQEHILAFLEEKKHYLENLFVEYV